MHAVALTQSAVSSQRDRCLQRAFEQFFTDGRPPAGVRSTVLRSWERSRAAGVDPDGAVLPPVQYPEGEIDDYRRRHPTRAGMEAVRYLTRELIDGGEHLVVLADADGVLLWVEGSLRLRDLATGMNFVPGAAWDERHAGTNAPGVALQTGDDAEVLSGEHYSRIVRRWSCAASVIRDPDTSAVVGVLDITWPGRRQCGRTP